MGAALISGMWSSITFFCDLHQEKIATVIIRLICITPKRQYRKSQALSASISLPVRL